MCQPDPTEEVEEEEEEENGSEENDEEDEMYKNQTNGLSGGKILESNAATLVFFIPIHVRSCLFFPHR